MSDETTTTSTTTTTTTTANLNGNLKLIESSLRCLANLYTSAQMAPCLVLALDTHLYAYDVGTRQAVNMGSLLKLHQLSRPWVGNSAAATTTKTRQAVNLHNSSIWY
jgi:hypothetical protein